jgi:hypothetical protein
MRTDRAREEQCACRTRVDGESRACGKFHRASIRLTGQDPHTGRQWPDRASGCRPMVVARRATLAGPLAISTAAHAVALGLLFLGAHLSWPAPPIPIEVRAAHRSVQRVGPVDKLGDRKSESSRHDSKATAGKSTKPAPPKAPPPPETTDLSPFAPDDANLVVLLRMDKLRRSPHRAGAEALLSALPDWSTLVAGSGVSPIDDFEALLIATADPHSITATFLAARHGDTPKVRALVTRTLPPGDPRVFKIVRPGLTILTQPEELARDMGDPRTTWLAQLEQFDRVAQADNGPAVLVTLSDAPALIRFGGGLPTPQAIALAATGDASPAVRVRIVFASADEATAFAREWPQIMQRYRAATALLGLAPALDGIAIDTKDENVELTGRIPEPQMRLGLNWVRALIPPRAPLDAGTAPQ